MVIKQKYVLDSSAKQLQEYHLLRKIYGNLFSYLYKMGITAQF